MEAVLRGNGGAQRQVGMRDCMQAGRRLPTGRAPLPSEEARSSVETAPDWLPTGASRMRRAVARCSVACAARASSAPVFAPVIVCGLQRVAAMDGGAAVVQL